MLAKGVRRVTSSHAIVKNSKDDEENVKDGEAFEDIGEAGLEVHRLVVEDKDTCDVA